VPILSAVPHARRRGHAWRCHARRTLIAALLTSATFSAQACDSLFSLAQSACNRLGQIWTEGGTDLYVTGYAWHNRSKYSAERIDKFNEITWGGGLGKSIYDEDGDWQGLYAMGWKDSYRKFQPVAGYAFLKIAKLSDNVRVGAGYTAFITARSEFRNYMPFPGVLPLVGAGYKNAMLYATYVPRVRDEGNVAFVFGRWQF